METTWKRARETGGRTSGSLALALPTSTVRCGDLEIDRVAERAVLAGRTLPLTGREYALLAYMAERANRVVQRSVLLATLWTSTDERGSNVLEVYDGSNVVNVYIGHLRRKLGPYGRMIETIRGFGYCLRPVAPGRPACDNDADVNDAGVAPPPSGLRVSA